MKKKLLTFIFIITIMFTLCSCSYMDKKTNFYKVSLLEELGLEDLPKPKFRYIEHRNFGRDIYGDIEIEEFHSYAIRLLNYLSKKFDYVGTSTGDRAGFGSSLDFYPTNGNIEEYYREYKMYDDDYIQYTFVYFNEEDLYDFQRTIESAISITYFNIKETMFSDEEYNFEIDLPGGTLMSDDYAIDYIDDSLMLDLFDSLNKYPIAYPNISFGYNDIISSSNNPVDAFEKIYSHYDNIGEIESINKIDENNLFYGYNIRYKNENNEIKSENLISFKLSKFDYDSYTINTFDDKEMHDIISTLVYIKTKDYDNVKLCNKYFETTSVRVYRINLLHKEYDDSTNLDVVNEYLLRYDVDRDSGLITFSYKFVCSDTEQMNK